MTRYLVAYLATGLIFGVLDFGWLSLMGQRLYQGEIGQLLAKTVRIGPAIAFYLIYIAGLVFFAVRPAVASGSVPTALLNGAVLGFVAYATYDLTNQATMAVWSTKVTLADLAWGTFASGVAAAAGAAIVMKVVGRG